MKTGKKRWIQSGVALLCSFAIVLSAFPVSADNDISSLENQASTLQDQLSGINEDILALSDEITGTQMQLEVLSGDMDRTADELKTAEENESKHYADMKTRIKYMYEHGNASMLEMLFSAEDMADFLNKADFIENLSSYDRNALDELQDIHQQIIDHQETLEAQQASLNDLQSRLKDQQDSLQAKASATSTDLADVQNRLEKAREEEARRIAAEEAARRAAAEAAAKEESGSSSDSSGNSGNSGSSSNSGNSGSSGSSSDSGSSGGGSVTTGGSINASSNDLTLLAAILECEALQDYDCLLAVATVIMNRVESPRFPNSISGVVYASGQFSPTWTGKLDKVLDRGPSSLSLRVAQDAINGARLSSVADCYYFLYAPSTSRDGIVIGDNVFFQKW